MPRKSPTQLPTPLVTTLARRFAPVPHAYTERDASLYALAVGAAAGDSSSSSSSSTSSSSSSAELALVYDGASGFAPLPTFPCTFPYFGVTAAVPFEEILPNFNPVSFGEIFFSFFSLSFFLSPPSRARSLSLSLFSFYEKKQSPRWESSTASSSSPSRALCPPAPSSRRSPGL